MNVAESIKNRIEWIKEILKKTHAKGIIYGNSGGKDCTLVGALCAAATDNVLGVIMPCKTAQNYGPDRDDALEAGRTFGIKQIEVDLSAVKDEFLSAMGDALTSDTVGERSVELAVANINPRIRMTVLYALGQAKGYLVAGTGNLDEYTVGYFTKWGDGGFDFNPIADLNVEEVFEHLRYLGAPESIINKAPSAGLYPGQTDEDELGIKYADIDAYVRGREVAPDAFERIKRAEGASEHKKRLPLRYGFDQ